MDNKTKGLCLMFITVVVWGISFVATKIALDYVPPITLGFLRFSIAALFMLFVIKSFEKYTKKDIVNLGLASFLGVTAYFLFENVALEYTTATNASLIAATVPIFYLLCSDIISKKVSSKLNYFGSLIGLIGVSVLILNGKFVLKLNPLGDLLMVGAVISWVLYTFIIQKMEKYDNVLVSRDITLIGALMFIPFTLIELNSSSTVFSISEIVLNVPVAVSIIYLAIFCSAMAYLFWNKAIRLAGAATTTNGIYFIPVVAIIADSLILKNIPNTYSIIGAILVLIGVYVSEKGDKLKLR